MAEQHLELYIKRTLLLSCLKSQKVHTKAMDVVALSLWAPANNRKNRRGDILSENKE